MSRPRRRFGCGTCTSRRPKKIPRSLRRLWPPRPPGWTARAEPLRLPSPFWALSPLPRGPLRAVPFFFLPRQSPSCMPLGLEDRLNLVLYKSRCLISVNRSKKCWDPMERLTGIFNFLFFKCEHCPAAHETGTTALDSQTEGHRRVWCGLPQHRSPAMVPGDPDSRARKTAEELKKRGNDCFHKVGTAPTSALFDSLGDQIGPQAHTT